MTCQLIQHLFESHCSCSDFSFKVQNASVLADRVDGGSVGSHRTTSPSTVSFNVSSAALAHPRLFFPMHHLSFNPATPASCTSVSPTRSVSPSITSASPVMVLSLLGSNVRFEVLA